MSEVLFGLTALGVVVLVVSVVWAAVHGHGVKCLRARQRSLSSAAVRSPSARTFLMRAFRIPDVDVERQLRAAFRAADWDEDAGARADAALVRQCGQALCGGLVQRGQHVAAGAVMSGTEPGSTSETHSGVPSGADRNCTLPPNALCFRLDHQSLPLPRTLGDPVAVAHSRMWTRHSGSGSPRRRVRLHAAG